MKYIIFATILLLFGCAASQSSEEVPMENKAPGDNSPLKPSGPLDKSVEDVKSKLAKTFVNQIEYKADYEVTVAGQISRMAQYFKDGNMRMDINNGGYEMRSYLLDEKFYTCNMATGSWMCQEMEYQKDASQDVQDNIQDYVVISLPPRIIAGANTDCYLVKAKQGDVEYCYSTDYVPLYIKTSASEMQATSYSKSVSASDLELPAKPGAPVDVSKLMEGYT